jgi:uncharacterized RDD family membrane protein YckC
MSYNDCVHTSPATLRSRFAALSIDFCIIVLYALVLFGVTATFYLFLLGDIPDILGSVGPNGAHAFGFAALTIPAGLYFFLTETSRHRATLGKRVAKLIVVARSEGAPSKKQIALRTAVKLLPWELAHTFIYQVVYRSRNSAEVPAWVIIGLFVANVLPLAYLVTVLLRKDHAGPHDLAAKTLVTARR